MSEKMSEKKRIVELLTKEALNSVDISEKLGIKIDYIYVYLNMLEKEKKVKKTSKKRPNIYRAITPLRYLIDLYSIMDNTMDYIKKPTDSEKQIVLEIEELIK